MHILLTDILTCPRCGPEHGLILLAERMSDRRVLEGTLGCANCREKYGVRDGVVVFTAGDEAAGRAEGEAESGGPVARADTEADADGGAALRFAALMGVTQGPGYVLLAGPAARHAAAVAAMIEDIEVVAPLAGDEAGVVSAGPGTNPLQVVRPLPLASARMNGIVLSGEAADRLLEEGCRVLAPLGRLVLEPAPADAAARIDACGLRVLAQEGATLIAVNRHAAPRTGPGARRS